jgi:heat shock protein HtpX
LYDQVAQNKRRSYLLLAAFVVVVAAVVWAFDLVIGGGGVVVPVIALVVAGGVAFFSYWKSDSVALAMSRARPADETEFARLHNLVEGLCIASGLPKPRIYVVDDQAPNAFATGRDPQHAAIAVTTGLLEKMNRVELEGVVAHELSHIKNYDILVSTLAVTLVGLVAILSDVGIRMLWWGGGRRRYSDRDQGANMAGVVLLVVGFVLLVASPIIARIMKAAVGRKRESLADMSGVEMTRYPPGLISALEKLRDDSTVVHAHSRATSHLWIEEPAPVADSQGRVGLLNRINALFATHPPLEERIAALREL